MKRSVRNAIASAIIALCPVSFCARSYLFDTYLSSRPRSPNLDLGFVQPLNSHGTYVYLTDVEATGMEMLRIAFFTGFLLAIAIVPKDFVLPPRGTPKWVTYVGAAFKHDLGNPSLRLWMIFLCSTAVYLAVVTLAGNSIARFIVSRGIILDL
jgi:hypothetical protein